jgi:hypothetical protein
MILTTAIIIIGMTAKIGHTGATCKNAIEITALTTTSEPETRETTGSGATSIPIAKRDAMTGTMTGTKRDRPTVKGGGARYILAFSPLLPLTFPEVGQQ